MSKVEYFAKDKKEAREIAMKYWGIKKPSKLPKLSEVHNGWFSFNNFTKGIFIKRIEGELK